MTREESVGLLRTGEVGELPAAGSPSPSLSTARLVPAEKKRTFSMDDRLRMAGDRLAASYVNYALGEQKLLLLYME